MNHNVAIHINFFNMITLLSNVSLVLTLVGKSPVDTNMKAATLTNISLKNLKNLTVVKSDCNHLIRCSSTVAQIKPKQNKMSSWQIHAYGDLSELQYSPQMRIPHITKPNQVLVKVEAASVNPIDVEMIGVFK